MQVSFTALPPPDQWSEHVLAYLRGLGVDRYRNLLNDALLKIKEFLFSTLKFGMQHPSYRRLLDVRIGHYHSGGAGLL